MIFRVYAMCRFHSIIKMTAAIESKLGSWKVCAEDAGSTVGDTILAVVFTLETVWSSGCGFNIAAFCYHISYAAYYLGVSMA